MPKDTTQRGRDAILKAVVEGTFNRLTTKTA